MNVNRREQLRKSTPESLNDLRMNERNQRARALNMGQINEIRNARQNAMLPGGSYQNALLADGSYRNNVLPDGTINTMISDDTQQKSFYSKQNNKLRGEKLNTVNIVNNELKGVNLNTVNNELSAEKNAESMLSKFRNSEVKCKTVQVSKETQEKLLKLKNASKK